MPTLDEQLTQSRDRITDILTSKRPSQGDIGSAMLRAVTGRTSYGDELNRIKATRLGEQKTLFDVLSGHKKLKQAGRQMDIAEGKTAAATASAEQKNWIEAVKELGDKLSTQDRAKLLEGMKTDPNSKTDPWGVGARIVRELGLRTYEKPEKMTYTKGNVNIDGKVVRARTKKGVTEILVNGKWKPELTGAPFTSLGVQAGSVGELSATDRSQMVKGLTEQRTAAFQMYQMVQRLKGDIDKSGDEGISITGAITRFVDGAQAQVNALARTFAPGEKSTPSGGVQKYIDSFDWSQVPAAKSAAIKSKITSLAYTFALAKNGTRPTDEDVNNMMKIIGGGAGSVSQMSAALHSAMQEVMDSYSLSHYEIMGEQFDWAGELEARGLGGNFDEADPGALTDEELLRQIGVQ